MLFDLPKCPLIFVIQSEGTSAFSGTAITLIRGGRVTSLTHLSSITHHFSHIAYNCITCIKNKHADFTSHVFFLLLMKRLCFIFLPGGGEDKGRLWWWEQKGKATIAQNRRVLNKHHWRRFWATQSKNNGAATICVSCIIHFPVYSHTCTSLRADMCLPAAQDIFHPPSNHNISSPAQLIPFGSFIQPSFASLSSLVACNLGRLYRET